MRTHACRDCPAMISTRFIMCVACGPSASQQPNRSTAPESEYRRRHPCRDCGEPVNVRSIRCTPCLALYTLEKSQRPLSPWLQADHELGLPAYHDQTLTQRNASCVRARAIAIERGVWPRTSAPDAVLAAIRGRQKFGRVAA